MFKKVNWYVIAFWQCHWQVMYEKSNMRSYIYKYIQFRLMYEWWCYVSFTGQQAKSIFIMVASILTRSTLILQMAISYSKWTKFRNMILINQYLGHNCETVLTSIQCIPNSVKRQSRSSVECRITNYYYLVFIFMLSNRNTSLRITYTKNSF